MVRRGLISPHREAFHPSLIQLRYVYVCINLGMEAHVLHAECQEEQLEVDPPIGVADVAQLQEHLSPTAPVAQDMVEKKRSRGVDCVRALSAGLGSRHRFSLVSSRANGHFRHVSSAALVPGRVILPKIVSSACRCMYWARTRRCRRVHFCRGRRCLELARVVSRTRCGSFTRCIRCR